MQNSASSTSHTHQAWGESGARARPGLGIICKPDPSTNWRGYLERRQAGIQRVLVHSDRDQHDGLGSALLESGRLDSIGLSGGRVGKDYAHRRPDQVVLTRNRERSREAGGAGCICLNAYDCTRLSPATPARCGTSAAMGIDLASRLVPS